ncbi:MAG: hypothetical protein V3V75_07260, partial [Thermoguttaceae bacterium]
MRNLLLGLAAVAMLTMFAAPAMADHRHHRGCSHWAPRAYSHGYYPRGYSSYSFYPRPYYRTPYRYPSHVRYGNYRRHSYYAPSG